MEKAPHLFTRDDTIFGVCEGLGEDFGIHPNILRVALAGFLFWNPAAAVATYLAVGIVVFLTRRLVPDPAPALESAEADQAVAERAAVQEAVEPEPVRLAA